MDPIIYIDRVTGRHEEEKVFGGSAINFLYGNGALSKLLGRPLNALLARAPFFSALYGWWQKRAWTKRKIVPFIKEYGVDPAEFREDVADFGSFNDFFIRQLKAAARPIASGDNVAIIPADGRYLFFPNIQSADGFLVKGQKFNLETLLGSKTLAAEYQQGTMVIARLCPSDYHRFHFPCDALAGDASMINGWLYSVNPLALKQNIDIFTQNKRAVTVLDNTAFGKVLYLEIGATNVGSIIQTYAPGQRCVKGQEKGYFSFGASSLILLFPPNSLELDADLVEASRTGIEIRCLMGQSMGCRFGLHDLPQ